MLQAPNNNQAHSREYKLSLLKKVMNGQKIDESDLFDWRRFGADGFVKTGELYFSNQYLFTEDQFNMIIEKCNKAGVQVGTIYSAGGDSAAMQEWIKKYSLGYYSPLQQKEELIQIYLKPANWLDSAGWYAIAPEYKSNKKDLIEGPVYKTELKQYEEKVKNLFPGSTVKVVVLSEDEMEKWNELYGAL